MNQKNNIIFEVAAKARRQRALHRVLSVLCIMVLLFTTNAIKFHADTLEHKSDCGYPDHEHDDSCYQNGVLTCTKHVHTDACYQTRPVKAIADADTLEEEETPVEYDAVAEEEDERVEEAEIDSGDVIVEQSEDAAEELVFMLGDGSSDGEDTVETGSQAMSDDFLPEGEQYIPGDEAPAHDEDGGEESGDDSVEAIEEGLTDAAPDDAAADGEDDAPESITSVVIEEAEASQDDEGSIKEEAEKIEEQNVSLEGVIEDEAAMLPEEEKSDDEEEDRLEAEQPDDERPEGPEAESEQQDAASPEQQDSEGPDMDEEQPEEQAPEGEGADEQDMGEGQPENGNPEGEESGEQDRAEEPSEEDDSGDQAPEEAAFEEPDAEDGQSGDQEPAEGETEARVYAATIEPQGASMSLSAMLEQARQACAEPNIEPDPDLDIEAAAPVAEPEHALAAEDWQLEYDEALLAVEYADEDYSVMPVGSFESAVLTVRAGDTYVLTLGPWEVQAEAEPEEERTEEAEPEAPELLIGTKRVEVEGAGYALSIDIPEAANLPKDATFVAMAMDSALYGDAALAAVDADENATLKLLALFDLTIYDGDAVIQPDAPLEIRVGLDDAAPEGMKVYAVHFPGTGARQDAAPEAGARRAKAMKKAQPARPETERIPATRDGADVCFSAESFSVYAIVGTVIEKNVLASDGHNYKITVTCGPEAGIPEDAELEVFELTGVAYDNLVPQVEHALNSVSASAGYARLFDISIVKDGEKLQPAAPVSVQITVEDIDAIENPVVVHFGEGPEIVDAVADGQIVSFEAESFSIYAVVDETKRLKYVFHNGNAVAATEYVKKGENLYDPGLEVDYGQTFIGWAFTQNETDETKVYSINQLNQKLNSETDWSSVEDLQEVHVYAITRDAYYLRYMTVDDHGKEIVLKTVSVRTDAENKDIVIDYSFTGVEGQTFEGWIDVSNGHLYQLNKTLTLDHHVDLYSKIHGRNWLVFDANAGGPGSGATYTPPQLLIGEDTTTRPADPTRKGYTFQGWYTNPEGTGTPFQFGNTISADTVLYAKWAPDNTDYYVIFWRQKASDEAGLPDDQKQYDYIESVKRSALTDSTATLTNADKNKSTGEYTNCAFNADRSDAQATVNADGTTTLNVYYDRNEYTLTFQVQGQYHYEYTPTTGNNGTQYGLVNGEYVQLTRHGWNNYYWTYGDTLFSEGTRYTGTRYTREYTNWTTIHTITALYDADIHDKWSFTGTNGVTYPTTSPNTSWTPQNSSTYTARITSMQRMPGENIVFHLTSTNNTTRYFHYYVEALDEDKDTRTYNGMEYVLRLEQPNDFNIVYYNDDFWLLEGFTRQAIAKSNNQAVNLSVGENVNWTTLNNNYGGNDNHLYFYYTRNKYTIHYISQGPHVTERSEKQDDKVYFEASQAPYGLRADGSWYYEPTNGKDGYFFAGWYEDEACTVPYDFNARMPANDVTVYAKWDTQRVRVVLVPTKDNAHNDEVQMANNQALAFRLDYKEPVSDENIKSGVIKRTGYRLVGWYTSPTFEEETLWNFNTEVSKEVPAVNMNYQSDDNPDWTNNIYGDNDGAHDNVKGILKLYAKWELSVDENSVYVEYEVPEEYCTHDSQGNLQTTIPVDEKAYVLTDQHITTTVKEPPRGYADGFKFAGWQLLNSDGSEAGSEPFVAGSTQEIDQSYIEQRTITDDFGNTATIKVIRLKAKFDIDEENVATMVTFDGNGGVTNDAAQDDRVTEAVQVNKTFSIPASGDFVREGYTQVGWAFDSTMTPEQFRNLVEQNTDGGTVNYDALAHLGVFEMGETVAADNKLLTEFNNWDPLENTIYAIWEANTYDVTVVKRVEGDAAADKMFTFNVSASEDYTLAQGDASFKLAKDGERSLANKVPYGAVLTIAEEATAGYSVKSVEVKQTTDSAGAALESPIISAGTDGGSYIIKGGTVITYTNEKAKEQKLRIHKIGDDAPDGLAGATFSLTAEGVEGFTDLTGLVSSDGTADAELGYLPGNDSADATLFVLPVGSYTLGETHAPANYAGLSGNVTLTVAPEGITMTKGNGSNIVELGEPVDGVYTLTVTNTRKKARVSLKKVVKSVLASDQEIPFAFTYKKGETDSEIKLVGLDDASGVVVDSATYYNVAKFGEAEQADYDTVPYGTVIMVQETADSGFTTTFKVNGGDAATGISTDEITVSDETVQSLAEGETGFDGKIEIEFTNTRKTGDFHFTKKGKDQRNADIALKDAVFALYTDASCNTALTPAGSTEPVTATSGEDGTVTFSGIPLGVTFYMKETKAPAGYAESEAVYSVTLTEEQTEGEEGTTVQAIIKDTAEGAEDVNLTEIPNTPIKVNVILEKHGDDTSGPLLNNAVFSLYDSDYPTDRTNAVPRAIGLRTGEDGEGLVKLGELSAGTYYLVETSAPDGYNMLTEDQYVKVDITADVDGMLVSYVQGNGVPTVAEPKEESGATTCTVKVWNISGVKLPSTGGPGTAPFTFGGVSLIAIAIALLLKKRMEA